VRAIDEPDQAGHHGGAAGEAEARGLGGEVDELDHRHGDARLLGALRQHVAQRRGVGLAGLRLPLAHALLQITLPGHRRCLPAPAMEPMLPPRARRS
jgi:hypothetical protein